MPLSIVQIYFEKANVALSRTSLNLLTPFLICSLDLFALMLKEVTPKVFYQNIRGHSNGYILFARFSFQDFYLIDRNFFIFF